MRNPFASPLWRNPAFVRVWTARRPSRSSARSSPGSRCRSPRSWCSASGAVEVAILRSLDLVAALVFGLVAGAWVDRLRRRPVLIWADLGRAVAARLDPGRVRARRPDVLATAGRLRAGGGPDDFFDSADNAYLPTIVEREQLIEANAALAASGSASEFLAFGIGGFLVQAADARRSRSPSTPSRSSSRPSCSGRSARRRPPPPPREDASRCCAEIREGLRLVVHDPVLRAFAGAQMALAALWGIFGATWFLFVLDELGLGPAVLGLVAGVGGVSSFVGAVIAARATRRWGIGPVAIVAMLLAAIGNVFIPLAPVRAPLVAIGCLVLQQLVADSAVTVYDITEVSVRQTLVEDRALGRVTSTFHVAAGVAQLVATLSAGVLAEASGSGRRCGSRRSSARRRRDPVVVAGPRPAAAAGGARRRDPSRRTWRRSSATAGRRAQAKSAATNASGSNGDQVAGLLAHADEADRDVRARPRWRRRCRPWPSNRAWSGRSRSGRPPRGTPWPGRGRSGRWSRRARRASPGRRRAGACR